jgi:hypothetical protein
MREVISMYQNSLDKLATKNKKYKDWITTHKKKDKRAREKENEKRSVDPQMLSYEQI